MISFTKCCVHFVRVNLSADELAWGFSWFPSPAPAAQQPVTRNPKKSSGKRQHYLQTFQAVNPQLLTVPPALLPFWGLWDSKTICLVVPAVGILPVLSIPALAVPPFGAVPAVAVVAVAAAREVGEVPALTVAMDVAVAAIAVPGGVTVAAAAFAVALDVVVTLGVVVAATALCAATTLPAPRDLAVATVPVVVVPFSDNATNAAAAFSAVGAGVCVVEALCSDAREGGNAAQIAGAGEARDTLCCRRGCDGALGVGGVLLC